VNGAPEKHAKRRTAPESKTLGKLYVVKAQNRSYVLHRNVREGPCLIFCAAAHRDAPPGHPWPGYRAGQARRVTNERARASSARDEPVLVRLSFLILGSLRSSTSGRRASRFLQSPFGGG
jgi:hypothetical protein